MWKILSLDLIEIPPKLKLQTSILSFLSTFICSILGALRLAHFSEET